MRYTIYFGRGSAGAVPNASVVTGMRCALLVLGMHRSGTSAFARVANLLGARLPEDVLPPVPGNNELGFWEPAGVVALHDEILENIGSRWDDYRAIPREWFASAAAASFRARMVELVREGYGQADLFVVKDPRVCRLVPFWLDVLKDLEVEPRFLLPFRDPLEVAASLQRRDGLDPAESVLIWLRHVLDAERDTRGYARAVASYSGLLTDWRSVVATIGTDLGITWPRDLQETALEIEGFLAAGQRHHCADDLYSGTGQGVPEWVAQARDALQRAADGAMAELPTAFDGVAEPFERGCAIFGPAQSGRVEYLMNKLEAERDNARAQIEYRDRLVRDLEARVAAEQIDAREQIEYRDRLVKELEARWCSPAALASRLPAIVVARLLRGRRE